MKKIKYLLFTILSILTCTCCINAESNSIGTNPFQLKWANEGQLIKYGRWEFFNSLEFNGGAITISYFDDKIILNHYDDSGKLIKEKEYENIIPYSGVSNNKAVYLRVVERSSGIDRILKIDENLNIIASKEFPTDSIPADSAMLTANEFGHKVMYADDKIVAIYNDDKNIITIDTDLKEWNILEYSHDKADEYFPDFMESYLRTFQWYDEYNKFNNGEVDKVDVITSAKRYEDFNVISGVRQDIDGNENGVLKVLDKQDKVVLEVVSNLYLKFVSPIKVGDYIVTLSTNTHNYSEIPMLVIIDMNGNIVYTEGTNTNNNEYYYYNLRKTETGFMIDQMVYDKNEDTYTMITKVYEPPFNIYTKTDGNGTIESKKVTEYSGKEIEFTVTPNEGYILEVVKVTDNKGNTIIFTDNKFTMPSSDVTIEATFIKEEKNPETSDVAIILYFIVMVIGGFIMFYNYRKNLN